MKKLKRSVLTAAVISLGLLTYLLITNNLSLSKLSDNFFLVALFFLIIGGALGIMASGFFDTFQYSMKHSWRSLKKGEPKEYIPLSTIGQAHARFWLETGGLLLMISIISLLFYFL